MKTCEHKKTSLPRTESRYQIEECQDCGKKRMFDSRGYRKSSRWHKNLSKKQKKQLMKLNKNAPEITPE
jgi:hypothetical protein